MTTTAHTQTLAQMLETADTTKVPSEEIIVKLLEEAGFEVVICLLLRASLRALPFIATALLDYSNKENAVVNLTSSLRMILLLLDNIQPDVLYDVDFYALYSDGVIAYGTMECIVKTAGYACSYNIEGDYIDNTSDYFLDAISCMAQDILWSEPSKQLTLNFIEAIFDDITYLVDEVDAIQLYKKKLWTRAPALFDIYKRKFSNGLRERKLYFLFEDLQCLWQSQFFNPDRFSRYAQDLSKTILSDAEQFRRVIEGDAETKTNPAVRVLLLGPGGAGKTSLAKLLKKQPSDTSAASTISIEHEQINLAEHQAVLDGLKNHEGNPFSPSDLQLFLWDFGGQTIFHNLHRGFMRTENCVYVLVVDSRHEQSPDQWLRQLKFHLQYDTPTHELLAPTVPVFLITNEYELVKRQQNQRRLLREFPSLLTENSFIYLSCIQQGPEFEGFLQQLVQQCVNSQYLLIKENADAIAMLNDQFSQQTLWCINDVEQALQALDPSATPQVITERINKLEGLGQIIRLGNGENYCPNPSWLAEAAYQFINLPIVREQRGVINARDIARAKQAVQNPNELIPFLLSNQVALSLRSDGQAPYFFPDAASENEPEAVQTLIANHLWQIHYDFAFLPLGFRAQLVNTLYTGSTRQFTLKVEHEKQGESEVWREGFIARHNNQHAQMLVQYDTDSRCIAVYLCGEPKQEVTFAGMVNELHKALCDITKQGNLQPNIITPLRIANGDAEHSNEHAYYQLANELQSHAIVIKALEAVVTEGDSTIKATKMQVEADDRNTQKQIDSQQAIGISQILFGLVCVVLGAILAKFL